MGSELIRLVVWPGSDELEPGASGRLGRRGWIGSKVSVGADRQDVTTWLAGQSIHANARAEGVRLGQVGVACEQDVNPRRGGELVQPRRSAVAHYGCVRQPVARPEALARRRRAVVS